MKFLLLCRKKDDSIKEIFYLYKQYTEYTGGLPCKHYDIKWLYSIHDGRIKRKKSNREILTEWDIDPSTKVKIVEDISKFVEDNFVELL